MPSRTSAVVAVASALLLLTGCASGSGTTDPSKASETTPSASPSSTAPTCATSGSASDAVKVTGAAKDISSITFPKPTTVTAIQRTTITKGGGAAVEQGATVEVAYALLDAKTGNKADPQTSATTAQTTLTVDKGTTLSGVVDALACSHVGDRFAAVIPASEGFGDQGQEQLGVGGGDSLVFVVDVLGLVSEKATGTPKALPAGFPKVTLAADGKPTVSIPAAKAPTTLKIADSEVGDGEVVKEGDSVTLQYQGVLWRDGSVFDQSWGKTGPTALTAATSSVIPGFAKALIGQRVGSQVVAIIPPADGYGSKGSGTIKGTDTLVFVIDILATSHAS